MKIEKLARKGILNLAAYVPGKAIEDVGKKYRVKKWIKLASNENLLGPSPKTLAAIRKELPGTHFYPEGPCTVLRHALAKKFSLSEKKIVISNGADNIIFMIANAFVDEGDEVVIAEPTFPVYTNSTQIMGGTPVKVPLREFTHDLPAMLKKVNRRTKLVYICNPNNPTGTIVTQKALNGFLSKLPERVIVVLDQAYVDFVEDPDYPRGLREINAGKQIIVVRTFSKVYGLAGVRVGYALGREDLIHCMYQVRDPFPVHRLAQVAALAALKDVGHEKRSVRLVQEGRRFLYKELDTLGLFYVPSQANFIFIDFGRDVGGVSEALLREGIIIRPGQIWKTPTFGRVTVGRRSDNRTFIEVLKRILER
jgi:histidinol-phosphate aminotransferase